MAGPAQDRRVVVSARSTRCVHGRGVERDAMRLRVSQSGKRRQGLSSADTSRHSFSENGML
ncbi:MAG TPA: hypothetical protein VJU80_04520, partial [Solirubrobacteraceae bacterium]|nr:hypothetical protein [Solirubrobacteraceae bacterium]